MVKGDLQRLGPLEVKVDSMLEKLTLLERVEKMMQKWQDSGRSIPVEQKRDKECHLRSS